MMHFGIGDTENGSETTSLECSNLELMFCFVALKV